MVLAKNKTALNFTLLNQSGEDVSLADFKGKWVVLYFYPKDNTPGCTIEAMDFSAKKKEFESLNCTVLGVSPDSVASHEKFCAKKSLTITLLSDAEKKVCEKYGVWQLKKFMGKEYMGVVRSTFLISPQGKVAEVWSPVRVKGHADAVLEVVKRVQ